MESVRRALPCVLSVVVAVTWLESGSAQQTTRLRFAATTGDELRAVERYVTSLERAGELQISQISRDPSFPSRAVERLQQYHRGVPVWGADVVRDTERGVPESIFGSLVPPLTIGTDPGLTAAQADERLLQSVGADRALLRRSELVVLPLDEGARLAYGGVASGSDGIFRVFVDARSGDEILRYSEIQTQAAVGTGRGVAGDTKKVAVLQQGGAYFADDQHRPPELRTYDMRADFPRTLSLVDGFTPFLPSDIASDADNDWTDVSAVDAHVHVGWTYDYYFKRHGRRGLNDRDRPLATLINAFTREGGLSGPPLWVINAFWCDSCGPGAIGVMFFGNGIPPNFILTSTGQTVLPLAGGLDVAAHELTHGVTSSTSRLIYFGESGALNEAFSDIMGTAVEYFYQTPGPGLRQADYLLGEDVFRALRAGSVNGIRSMANPLMFGDPDHYSIRFTGRADNGGVHINSGIANHAYYLAIEGGTNQTSGTVVQGVGLANREQIEKVFYRAFVFLLPANATFSTARAATIQAARDLYGAGSAPERAVTQAWTAVGVN
jgi:thermolysin